jgi:DNA (cytosine-5)-methyltransferase 3A
MKQHVLLSLFAGYGGSRLSAQFAGLKIKKEYASEVNKSAIAVMKHNHPDIILVGDVRNLRPEDFLDVTLITAGSPCPDFSFCGNKKGMVTKDKKGNPIEILTLEHYVQLKEEEFEFDGESYLFWEFVRLYYGIRDLQIKMGLPVLKFMLENVKMIKKWENVISDALGVKPILFDAAVVWGQNRERLFWVDIDGVTVPEDRGITIGDLIKGADNGTGFRGREGANRKYFYPQSTRKDNKSNCLLTSLGSITKKTGKMYGTGFYTTKRGDVKLLTISEAEILQGLDEGYTNVKGVSDTARIKMIGNGWCIPVTGHIMSFLKKNKKVLKSKKI